MSNLKAVGEYIIVTPIEITESKTGILIEGYDADPLQRGKVVSVGEKLESFNLKPGQVIIFSRAAGDELEQDGEKYIYIKGKHALGILDE